jgi:hypothetical protein
MTTLKQLNDPEYRWYHKEEMSKIMPFTSIRNKLGIAVIDYQNLRVENFSKIKEDKHRDFSWDRLHALIDVVPDGLDRTKSKSSIQPQDRLHFEKRFRCRCQVCGNTNTSNQLHHIIPTGEVTDENIVTLCFHCHSIVHEILFLSGKWKYSRVAK